jgi:hypothetical protein
MFSPVACARLVWGHWHGAGLCRPAHRAISDAEGERSGPAQRALFALGTANGEQQPAWRSCRAPRRPFLLLQASFPSIGQKAKAHRIYRPKAPHVLAPSNSSFISGNVPTRAHSAERSAPCSAVCRCSSREPALSIPPQHLASPHVPAHLAAS